MITDFRIAFTPMKLRFAMLLADVGHTAASYEYALKIKNFIHSTEETHAASHRQQANKDKRGYGEKGLERKKSKVFSTKFARAVEEFYDRISKTITDDVKATAKESTGSITKSSSGSSLWDYTGSILAGANLKDFVDGTSQEPTVSKPLVPPKSQPPISHAHPVQSTLQLSSNMVGTGYQATGYSVSEMSLLASPSFPSQTSQANNTAHTNSVPMNDQTLKSSNSDSGATKRERENKKEKENKETVSSGPGVISNVRKSLLGFLYPDAKDANDNLGTANTAYYDEVNKRWVFPGEENDPDASIGPPPSGPMMSVMGSGVSGPPVGDAAGGNDVLAAMMAPPSRGVSYSSSSSSGNDQNGAYDPLAAMMAPPPRSQSYGASSASMTAASSGLPPKMWQPPPVVHQHQEMNGTGTD